MSTQIINITWQNIPIEISYNNNWSDVIVKNYGYALANIVIKSQNGVPIPMSNKGCYSRYIANMNIVNCGGIEKFVLDWLNHTAQSKKWKKYIAQSCQLTLDLF